MSPSPHLTAALCPSLTERSMARVASPQLCRSYASAVGLVDATRARLDASIDLDDATLQSDSAMHSDADGASSMPEGGARYDLGLAYGACQSHMGVDAFCLIMTAFGAFMKVSPLTGPSLPSLR